MFLFLFDLFVAPGERGKRGWRREVIESQELRWGRLEESCPSFEAGSGLRGCHQTHVGRAICRQPPFEAALFVANRPAEALPE